MIINYNTVYVYDVEVFPNVFTCTVKNTETEEYNVFEISERRNDTWGIVDFFTSGGKMFCGYILTFINIFYIFITLTLKFILVSL